MNELPVCPYCGKQIVSEYFEGSYEDHIEVCGQVSHDSKPDEIIHLLEMDC